MIPPTHRTDTSTRERISCIAACSRGRRAIGRDNTLLWRIPGDLPRFKALTMGHPVIMGRGTFQSIGKPLPGRTNIVLSRDESFAPSGVIVHRDIVDALETAGALRTGETFIIGGAQIYAAALPRAERLYLTLVDDEPPADAFFPPYENTFTRIVSREPHPDTTPPHEYAVLERLDGAHVV